ncbi:MULTISPECIES: STAS domain-containing protein [Streptomyces]|uniref:STAS domain-containing protein n=1 Tax=Streptomyces TaxID=1883 RepID=UPI00068FDA62|nr:MULTISPECIES: STAS domain-containing protein [unclassified Streptomyces]KPC84197.1 anti-anti-sigma factor [Streptomyces sp. NRRL S-4]
MTALPHPLITVAVEAGPRTVRLRIGGDLDYDTSGELAAKAETCLGAHGPDDLHLDCADLRVCDSMGVSTLLLIHRSCAARGVRLHLDAPPPFLERILAVTGIRHLFETTAADEQPEQAHADEGSGPAAPAMYGLPPRTPSG